MTVGLSILCLAAIASGPVADRCLAAGEKWSGDGVSWVRPEGWKQKARSGLRFATLYRADDEKTEITVYRFGPNSGGLLANVNRWRAQVGLQPTDEATLKKESRVVKADKLEAIVVDLKGESKRIVGAILPTQNATWFFKLTASPKVAGKHKADVPKLVESVRFKSE